MKNNPSKYHELHIDLRSQFGGRSSGWSLATTSQLNTSLASNIQKMFNEKIEIFSPVEFSRISILTGIVKIALKTLLECVRLRTFSRFGFQQMQVDTHYLSLFLWRFVSDEHLVNLFLSLALSQLFTNMHSLHLFLGSVSLLLAVISILLHKLFIEPLYVIVFNQMIISL